MCKQRQWRENLNLHSFIFAYLVNCRESLDNDAEFQIVSDISELKAKEDDSKSDATAAAAAGDSSSKPSPKVDGGEKNKNGAGKKSQR